MIKISELYIYPVKSLAGIKLKTSKLSPFGLQHDRRWMIVDDRGHCITQREIPKMATIKTSIVNSQLTLSHIDTCIDVPEASLEQINVTVWKDIFKANKISSKVDLWLSKILNHTCHLVYMPKQAQRQIDPDFAKLKQYVSFADAFPLLVISQASLDDLNQKLETAVNINRFRPNIVVTGTDAFAEDNWLNLSINDIEFLAVKKCSRCIIPSINQQSGIKDKTKMLAVLNKYRKIDSKIKFGQNLIYKQANNINRQIISCGDEIKLNY